VTVKDGAVRVGDERQSVKFTPVALKTATR
jgi:hypothetical protein